MPRSQSQTLALLYYVLPRIYQHHCHVKLCSYLSLFCFLRRDTKHGYERALLLEVRIGSSRLAGQGNKILGLLLSSRIYRSSTLHVSLEEAIS